MRSKPATRALPRDLLPFALLWLLYALLVDRFWFLTDDAFISFRYARNWALGLGLRFNPGSSPPVEGYSDFLWVVVLALLRRLGVEPELAAPLLSFAAGSFLLWRLWHLLSRDWGLGPGGALPGALFLGLLPAWALWSTGGLETAPYALLVFLLYEQLFLRPEPRPLPAGLLALGLALLRVEGIGWALLLLGLAWLRGRRVARPLALLLGGYALYTLGRLAWFGAFLPNTVVAKVGMGPGVWWRGLCYDLSFLLTFPGLLLALLGLRGAGRPGRSEAALLLGGFFAYALLVGGCHMPMGRFLVPALPFAGLLLALGLRRLAPLPRWALLAAVLAADLLPGWDHHLVPESIRARFHFRWNTPNYASEYAIWRYELHQTDLMTQVGLALARYTPPGARVVLGAVGAAGYYSDRVILDRFGLVTPEVARQPVEHLRSPGHDRRVDIWFFLPEQPEVLFAAIVAGRSLAEAVRPYALDLRRHGAAERYVPWLDPLGPRHPGGPPRFLLTLRRIPDGYPPGQAWDRAERRLWELEGG